MEELKLAQMIPIDPQKSLNRAEMTVNKSIWPQMIQKEPI